MLAPACSNWAFTCRPLNRPFFAAMFERQDEPAYPSNLSVCEQLIEPYNKDQSKSALPGEYFCEELR
jgi:hypothetical protein